ncbi:MAG: hypothetical protein FGM26_11000 [Beijerinckiaceae bacterium]|nr:hypothetical protein [Beijerinckiaceae bacterium]
MIFFSFTTENDVFNFQALILGSVTMLVCLFCQAVTVGLTTTKIKPQIGKLAAAKRIWIAQAVFFGSALILLCSHLFQIYLWGYSLYWAGVIKDPHTAMVFAGSTYTTVGFVNDPLPIGWQLLTIIMATTGLFSFGWSTSVMFLLSQTLYPAER